MTRYQLAKLVSIAGTLRSRKRLQKIVYLLKASGCPIELSFRLHHYGPYSQELGGLVDELVQLKVLREHHLEMGNQRAEYSYELSDLGYSTLDEVERSGRVDAAATELCFSGKLQRLLNTNLRQLELASTIAYYRTDLGKHWQEALELTCKFKEEQPGTDDLLAAEQLARELVDSSRVAQNHP